MRDPKSTPDQKNGYCIGGSGLRGDKPSLIHCRYCCALCSPRHRSARQTVKISRLAGDADGEGVGGMAMRVVPKWSNHGRAALEVCQPHLVLVLASDAIARRASAPPAQRRRQLGQCVCVEISPKLLQETFSHEHATHSAHAARQQSSDGSANWAHPAPQPSHRRWQRQIRPSQLGRHRLQA